MLDIIIHAFVDRYPEVLHQENITKILVSFRGERQEPVQAVEACTGFYWRVFLSLHVVTSKGDDAVMALLFSIIQTQGSSEKEYRRRKASE